MTRYIPRHTVSFENFGGGWAGDVDRARALPNQWFGQDVMVYTDGLLGPRHPLRKVTITAPPTVPNSRIDEGLIVEHPTSGSGQMLAAAGTSAWALPGFSTYDSAVAMGNTYVLPGTVGGMTTNAAAPLAYLTLGSSATRMVSLDPFAGGVTNITVSAGNPFPAQPFVHWNDRMVYAFANQIIYSDAVTFNSWPAVNTYTVGDGGEITGLIATPLSLYVAKQSGWWVVTGVLGSTAVIRQVREREGVEQAQVAGGAPNTLAAGVRVAVGWDRGILFLRRRANDYESDLGSTGVVPTSAVENSELVTFTGSTVKSVGLVRCSRQARLVGMGGAAALVDCQNTPVAPAVQHAVYVVGANGTMSRHIFASSVMATADQVICPLQFSEGANSRTPGYDPDHLYFAYADDTGHLAVAGWRWRASRPGYGSDVSQVDSADGTVPNVVGVFETSDYYSPLGFMIKPLAVAVSFRKYDNSASAGGGHFAATARLRCTATVLGRVEQTGSLSNLDSTEREWSEFVDVGEGDQDMMHRFKADDAGFGLGFRIRLEMEQVAIRRVMVLVESEEMMG